MIGRAAIGYPWIFREIKYFMETGQKLPAPTMNERIETVTKHLLFSVSWKGPIQGILEMRRHYTNYFKGIPNIKPIRTKLMEAGSEVEVMDLLNKISMQLQEAEA